MDKKEALKQIKAGKDEEGNNYFSLADADEKLKADKEVVLAAVKQNGYALEHAYKKLRADKEVVLAAVKQDGYALKHADKKLKADKKIVMAKTKAQIKNFKKLEQEAHNGTAETGYYNDDPEYNYCLGRFAEDLCLAGYKKWARKIYKIAEGKFNRGQMDASFSLLNLANDVAQNLGDKKWASKIYKEAEKDDEVERSELAESISENLGDKEWAKKIQES